MAPFLNEDPDKMIHRLIQGVIDDGAAAAALPPTVSLRRVYPRFVAELKVAGDIPTEVEFEDLVSLHLFAVGCVALGYEVDRSGESGVLVGECRDAFRYFEPTSSRVKITATFRSDIRVEVFGYEFGKKAVAKFDSAFAPDDDPDRNKYSYLKDLLDALDRIGYRPERLSIDEYRANSVRLLAGDLDDLGSIDAHFLFDRMSGRFAELADRVPEGYVRRDDLDDDPNDIPSLP